MLGVIDIKISCCETNFNSLKIERHYLLFACIFVWCFSLWRKFVIKGPIFSTFFRNKRCWEQDCNIPSWAQHCFKKSFLALKNRTFPVKSKTTKLFNKADHYNSFFFSCSNVLRHNEGGVNETTIINRMSS